MFRIKTLTNMTLILKISQRRYQIFFRFSFSVCFFLHLLFIFHLLHFFFLLLCVIRLPFLSCFMFLFSPFFFLSSYSSFFSSLFSFFFPILLMLLSVSFILHSVPVSLFISSSFFPKLLFYIHF